MKLLGRVGIGLGIAGFALCCFAVLLFNRPALGWQLLSVPTGSMRPSISPGSLVLVHRVPDSSLRVGDVITYTNPMTLRSTLTHRIVGITHPHGIVTYTTKGDANPSPDQPVVGGLVQGRMAAHVPFAGSLLLWAKSWPGLIVLVYLPALVIVAEETRRLAVYLRTIRPYKLAGSGLSRKQATVWPKVASAGTAVVVVALAGFCWQAGASALAGNVVALAPNRLRVAARQNSGSCGSSTNVTVSNSSNQTANSGNASNSGNTNGGSAASGNASNSNSTNLHISVTNGC